MRRISETSFFSKYCQCSSVVAMLCMHAKFVDLLARQTQFSDIQAVCKICFLNAKNIKPVEIYCQICGIFGQNSVNHSMIGVTF